MNSWPVPQAFSPTEGPGQPIQTAENRREPKSEIQLKLQVADWPEWHRHSLPGGRWQNFTSGASESSELLLSSAEILQF